MTSLQLFRLLLFAFLYLFANALVKWRRAGPRDDRFIRVGWLLVYGAGSVLATCIILIELTHPAFVNRVDAPFPVAWLFWFYGVFDALVVVDLAVKAVRWLAHQSGQS